MKKIFFLLCFLLIGCSSHKIFYFTKDINVSSTTKPIPISVNMLILNDKRSENEENFLQLESKSNEISKNDKNMCINAEKYYSKGKVALQITGMMVEHFNKIRLFDRTSFNNQNNCDYYLSGNLWSFFGEQEQSLTGAISTALFGAIGGAVTAGIKTPTYIKIEITELKLFKSNGELVKDFGNFSKEYKEEFPENGSCERIFDNMNARLKKFNAQLAQKIRTDLENISFKS